MSEENVSSVRAAYEAFNSGDPQGVIDLLAEDVAWTEPGGGNAPSGTFNSPDSVANDVLATVPANFDEFAAETEDLKDDGDTVVVTGQFRGKSKTGVDLAAAFTHTYEFRDGKVVKFSNKVEDNWAEAWS